VTVAEARKKVGGLSNPSKMPGLAYGLPAKECKVGSTLVQVKGSVCHDCYALKNMYCFKTVQDAQYRRLRTITLPDWEADMIKAIHKQKWFRWHDSGDIQTIEHLRRIAKVCEGTPDTKHWLPTREKRMVRGYHRLHGSLPTNLIVRVSAAMVDGSPPLDFPNTSTIHKDAAPVGQDCPAYRQEGKCGDCRACWDKNVTNVSYPLH
jgi:hypothetical protein